MDRKNNAFESAKIERMAMAENAMKDRLERLRNMPMLKAKVMDIPKQAAAQAPLEQRPMDPRIEAEMKRAADPIPGSVQDEESRRIPVSMPARSAAEARLEEMEGFIPSSDTSA